MPWTITRTNTAPPDSIILDGVSRLHDYIDCFSVTLSLSEANSIDFLTAQLFKSTPTWADALLVLRNSLVKVIGLKTGRPSTAKVLRDVRYERGDQAGFFKVIARTEEEIVLAEEDRHLDFRTSVRRSLRGDGTLEVQSTTVVWFNNALGRFYFAIVQPFHGAIVRSLLRRFALRMAEGTPS